MSPHHDDITGPRLVLAPASERGWFGGRRVVASGATAVRHAVEPAEAAAALEAAFDGTGAPLVAVLAPYQGPWTVAEFSAVESGPVAQVATTSPSATAPLLVDATWDLSPRAFRAAVEITRERIAAGDVYVLNLTARLHGVLAPSLEPERPGLAARVFEELTQRAPADMAALLEGLPGGPTPWVASVSPERFVRIRLGEDDARIVEVCPIKGTSPRGITPEADDAAALALECDPKERAEHVMVVDLERNDLGVCCVPGTVHVDPLYQVVPTPYCHQLVSTVRGTLTPQATFARLLAATFPCGSVTGAPKVAAMRIIDELEAGARGAYCGALIVAMRGELDSSVLIRTLEAHAHKPAHATWGAGCGITHDSDPAAEYLELLLKASPVTGDAPPAIALRETMRVAGGRAALLDRHLARLASGGTGPSTLARVRAAVARAIATDPAAAQWGRLGVTVTPDGEVAAGLTIQPSSLEVEGGPVIVPVAIDALPQLPEGAAKPALRRFWDKAHHAARLAGAHQALLHLPDGTVVDGSTASVWLLHGSTLSTPPAPPAIAGVMREVVFDRAPLHGLCAVERPLTLDDVRSADAILLGNAVGGLVLARWRDRAPGHSAR